MCLLTKRAIGTMLHAAPAFANHGTYFAWLFLFARVIVGLLGEAQAPEFEHLWVFVDDDPGRRYKRGKGYHRHQTKSNEENRYADECDRHPCCEVEAELGPRTIQRLIDW